MNRVYLPYRPNRYDFGSFILNGKGLGNFGKAFGANGSASDLSGALNAVGHFAGGIANGAIGGGLQSGAGNIINGLGNVAGAIPGPWGAVASAGLGIIGGLTNRVFGSKLNKENINTVNDNINRLKNFNSNVGSFDDLTSTMGAMPTSLGFGNSYIGKDGWFSHKAKRKANQLRQQQEQAQLWADDSIMNNLQNLQDEQYDNMLANFSAMGGPLSSYGADWTNGLKIIDAGGTHEQNPHEGVQMGVDENGTPNLVEQGEVVWNDYVFSNRLTVPSDVKEFLKVKGNDNMTFADAAKKLQKNSEERPNDPIEKRGLNSNLTRLMNAQEQVRKANEQQRQAQQVLAYACGGLMGNKYAGLGDRPNMLNFDNPMLPWSLRGQIGNSQVPQLQVPDLGKLTLTDAAPLPKWGYDSYVGNSNTDWSKGLGTYSSKLGFAEPNYRSKGFIPYTRNKNFSESNMKDIRSSKNYTDFTNYILNNWDSGYAQNYLKALDKAAGGNHLFDTSGNPVKGAKDYFKKARTTGPAGYYSYTPESNKEYPDWLQPRKVKDIFGNTQILTPLSKGFFTAPDDALSSFIDPNNKDTKDKGKGKNSVNPLSYLRFVPAIGAGIGVFSDLMGITNKPDYSNADMVLNASNGLRDVRFTPIGDYEKYSPFDRMYYINQLNANAGATRRALLDTTGGNRGTAMAGLLAADYNAQNQLGALARQAEEYNLAQRNQVSAFNRQTNEYNSEGDLKAQIANNSNREVQMRASAQAAALRDAVDARVGAAKSANLTNFFNSLGDIGREAFAMDMIKNNPWLLYDWNGNYKGSKTKTNAAGGYITIKNKRRK